MMQPDCPLWVQEEPFLQRLLEKLLRKWEAGTNARISIREKDKWCYPLFDYTSNNGPRLFSLLQLLSVPPLQVLQIKLARGHRKAFETEYEGAVVELNPEAVATLRHWLQIPAFDANHLSLSDAVFRYQSAFADEGKALLTTFRRLTLDCDPDELIAAFASIPQRTEACLSLRELSASCFWGDSKFLDQREDLLASLFPNLQLGGRTQLLQVLLPPVSDGLLFVENQTTFIRACLGRLTGAEQLTVVYCAGFRAAAEGIRRRERVLFAFVDVSMSEKTENLDAMISAQRRHAFESAWFDLASELPVYFFGDLDDSGMAILTSLRRQFYQANAWQPGYAPMVNALLSGKGHQPHRADKSLQKLVFGTGCVYADDVLIPAMRQTGRYLDQEYQPA